MNIWVEAALLPRRIEGSHRRPSMVHLINQPPVQHGTAKKSDGACSYTIPIVINRAGSSEKGQCSLYWLLCHVTNRAEQLAIQDLATASTKWLRVMAMGGQNQGTTKQKISVCRSCQKSSITLYLKFIKFRAVAFFHGTILLPHNHYLAQ